MSDLSQFPWAGLASVLGALAYLVKQAAAYRKQGLSELEVLKLLDERERRIMASVRQMLSDMGLMH